MSPEIEKTAINFDLIDLLPAASSDNPETIEAHMRTIMDSVDPATAIGSLVVRVGGSYTEMNRQEKRAARRNPFVRGAAIFGPAVAAYAVENNLDQQQITELISSYIDSLHADVPEASEMLANVTTMYVDESRALDVAAVTLEVNIYDEDGQLDPQSASEIMSFIQGRPIGTAEEDKDMLRVISRDWQKRGKDSVAERILKHHKETLVEQAPRLYLNECLENPLKWTKQQDVLKLVSVIAKKEGEELVEALLLNQADWDAQLKLGYQNFVTTITSSLDLETRQALARNAPPILTGITMTDLDDIWREILAAAPNQSAQNGSTAKSKRKALKRQKPNQPETGDTVIDLVEQEAKLEPKQILSLRRTETSEYAITDQDNNAIEDMIAEFVEPYKGSPLLADDLRNAFDYLSTHQVGKGIKKFKDRLVSIVSEPKPLQLHSLKPVDAPGVVCHSRIARMTRIEFVRLENEAIGIIRILRRDRQNRPL